MFAKIKVFLLTVCMVTGLLGIRLHAADLLDQNDFNDGTPGLWYVYESAETNTDIEIRDGEYVISVNEGGVNDWDIQFNYPDLTLKPGCSYKVKFKVRSTKDTRIRAKIGFQEAPYTEFWNNSYMPYDLKAGETLEVSDTFTVNGTLNSIMYGFQLGGSLVGDLPCELVFDDIYLEEQKKDEGKLEEIKGELLTVNDFDGGKAGDWNFFTPNPEFGSAEISGGEYVLHINNGGFNIWDIQLDHKNLKLEEGHTYRVRFKMYSTADAGVYVKVKDSGDPYRLYWSNNETPFELKAGQAVEIDDTFTMEKTIFPAAMSFQLGSELTGAVPYDVFFDDIYLEDISYTPVGKYQLLEEGGFDEGQAGPWTIYEHTDADVSSDVADNRYVLAINEAGAERWSVQFKHPGLTLEEGHTYTVKFKVSADKNASLYAKVGQAADPYIDYWNNNDTPYALTAGEELTVEETFTMESATESGLEMAFHLGGDLAGRAPYTLVFDDISLTDAAYQDESPARPLVRVNQVGYFPEGKKRAVLINSSTEPVEWFLKDNTGAVAASGFTTVFGDDPASEDFVHHADFTSYTAPGTGFTISFEKDGAEQASHPFDIREDLYSRLKYETLSFFYHNRSGIAIEAPYAAREDLIRPAGHPRDIMSPWPGSGTVSYELDLSGGWYDAGDYGKYAVNGGISVWTMQNQYERTLHTPGADRDFYEDGKMNIPENNNGYPDILDEARWEMEMLLAMQVPEGNRYAGMVHHKGHDIAEMLPPYAPHERTKPRYFTPPSTAATLNLAAAAAQAARLWEKWDPVFAQRCLDAAEKAWTAALANPEMWASTDISGGYGMYEDFQVKDEFYWAGCELFVTTGKAEYKEYIEKSEYYLQIGQTLENGEIRYYIGWKTTHVLGSITLSMVPSTISAEERAVVRDNIIAAADHFVTKNEQEGYLLALTTADYYWGSNSVLLNNILMNALAYDYTGETKYFSVVTDGLDYLLGRNAVDQSYISGYGERPFVNTHHRFWAYQADPAYPVMPPGVIAGGANNQTKIIGLENRAPQKMYLDHYSSYAHTEVCINWNAPLAWITAFIDEKMSPEPLEVEIVKPVTGGQIKNCAVLLKARTKGDTAYVEFYVDGYYVGRDDRAPYYGIWFNFIKGQHIITAKAVGTDGREVTSSEVIVTSVRNKTLEGYLAWLFRRCRKYSFFY